MSQLFAGLGWSILADTASAWSPRRWSRHARLHGHAPSVAFVTTTVEHDAQRCFGADRGAAGVSVHGITTSLGLWAAAAW